MDGKSGNAGRFAGPLAAATAAVTNPSAGKDWIPSAAKMRDQMIVDRDEEEEKVVQIPVYVRTEYETEVGGDDGASMRSGHHGGSAAGGERGGGGKREKKEQAYWCVLTLGKIAPGMGGPSVPGTPTSGVAPGRVGLGEASRMSLSRTGTGMASGLVTPRR